MRFCPVADQPNEDRYTYYAFSTISLPFPRFLKKSLTRLQITQFLVGGEFSVYHEHTCRLGAPFPC